MMNTSDNIAAPATGIGGAISILRISGPDALAIGNRVWHGKTPLSPANARTMLLGHAGSDSALAVYMKAPASYTGDDVVELHCHGGAATADALLRLLLSSGCRMAEPGEFTFRAFVNGKMDLVQAEAVADVIGAGSEQALNVAERQLAGSLSRRLDALWGTLNELRAECESHLDFPEEELAWDPDVAAKINAVAAELGSLLETRELGATLRDGVSLVLAGRPNAGKSSLLNRLVGYDRAIVTAIPGTTRDTVEVSTVLRGLPVRLTDTAGLRRSDDPIEQEGVERSRRSIAATRVTFWLLDASAEQLDEELAELEHSAPPGRIAVWNKIDLVPDRELPELPPPVVKLSAKTGAGLDSLLDAFAAAAVHDPHPAEPEVAVNARHAALLREALELLPEAVRNVESGDFEIASAQLREARRLVGAITGRSVEPDILDHIFSRFCIGK